MNDLLNCEIYRENEMDEMDNHFCQYDSGSDFSTSSCDESSSDDDEIIFNKKAKNQKFNYKTMSIEQKHSLLSKSLISFNTVLKTIKITSLTEVFKP